MENHTKTENILEGIYLESGKINQQVARVLIMARTWLT